MTATTIPWPWLFAAIALPALGGVATWPLRGRARSATAAATLLVSAAAALALVVAIARSPGPATWELTGPAGSSLTLVADGLSAGLLLIVALVGSGVGAVALWEDRDDARQRHRGHWPLSLVLWAGLVALALVGDLLSAYLLLELVGLCGALLVTFRGGRAPLLAGARYLVAELIASLTMLFGVALVWWQAGTVAYAGLGAALADTRFGWVGLAVITVGLLVKMPLAPLHIWLPAAHTQAPSAVSPFLSGVMVKAAVVVLARLWFLSTPELLTPEAARLLGGLGALAVVWGSLTALRSRGLKRLVAASTVSQLGLLLLSVPLVAAGALQGWTGALVLVVTHGVAKAAMLLAITCMAESAADAEVVRAGDGEPPPMGHDPELDRLAGSATRRPVALLAFGVAALSLVGLPPTGGFIAKWYLLLGAVALDRWWIVGTIVLATLLTAAYLTRFLLPAFATPEESPPTRAWDARDVVALLLAATTLVFGLLPRLLVDLAQVGAPVSGG